MSTEKSSESVEKHPFLDIERQLYYPSIRPPKTFDVTRLQLLAVAFVILGLVGIYIWASMAPAPVVPIREIIGSYLMNYATVYVQGVVTDIPRVTDEGGKIRITFYVNDGSTDESLSIFVYDPESRDMLKAGVDKIPFPGDQVKVLIQVRVRATFTYGILNDIDFLYILNRSNGNPVKVYDLSGVEEYKYVEATGTISQLRYVSSGILLTIDTGNSSITALIPLILDYMYQDDLEYQQLKSNLSIGARITIRGIVYYYRGYSPEIVPRCKEDIEVYGIPFVRLSDIGNYVGETVRFEATLGEVLEYVSGNYKVNLYSEGTQVVSSIPSPLFIELNPFYEGVGSKGMFIAKVDSPTSVTVYSVNITDPYPSPLVSIGDVTEDMEGYTIAVKGVIVEEPKTGSIVLFTLDDGTGSIKIFMPGSVFSNIPSDIQSLIAAGNEVVLAGYVEIYKGELEIVVYTSTGVQPPSFLVPGEGYQLPSLGEVAPTPPPSAPTTVSIGELSNYIGGTVTVEGILDKVGYYSDSGDYYLVIHDDTGSCEVRLSRSLIQSTIDPWNVSIGSRIRVTGSVTTIAGTPVIMASELQVVSSVKPEAKSISEIKQLEYGAIVVVENAEVTSFQTVGSGNWLLKISDGTDTITVFVPGAVASQIGFTPSIGMNIDVAGYYTEYKGSPEIVVYTPDGLKQSG